MENSHLITLVNEMKKTDQRRTKTEIFSQINAENTLTGKCILARMYLTPQSTEMETICRNDLRIDKPETKTSGDGYKNGIHYEIKISLHAKNSKINFVQIRPDHQVEFYILIAYNMYENCTIGKAYIFKIPSDVLYKLIVDYGGYAHGTRSKLGKITYESMIGRGCEYALRCNPNAQNGNCVIWKHLLKYEVPYDPSFF